MLRLTKLTDYGIVLMAYIAFEEKQGARTARDLAELSGLPLPTVSKVLKMLARGGLLVSHRGKNGGYTLVREANEISVAEMLEALEGPLALTDCATHDDSDCDISSSCPVKTNWRTINDAVNGALKSVKLSEMTKPAPKSLAQDVAALARGPASLEVVS